MAHGLEVPWVVFGTQVSAGRLLTTRTLLAKVDNYLYLRSDLTDDHYSRTHIQAENWLSLQHDCMPYAATFSGIPDIKPKHLRWLVPGFHFISPRFVPFI